MKKIGLLLLPALLFCLLTAATPPYVRTEITMEIDGVPLEGKMIRTDATHARRAEEAGGYAALYEELIKKYTAREALDYLGVGLGAYLEAECAPYYVPPKDATLEWRKDLSHPFRYHESEAGREADLESAGRAVAHAMDKGGTARIATREVAPKVTVRDLKKRTVERARFSTNFRTSGENRRHNVALAASLVNGIVIESGENFSFNAVVGERTAARGFREANIVVNGDFVKGIGGGVCQVSTTLYNAVLLAGLRADHAAAHSRPVSYVPYSRDCTVSSAIDFTFTNETAHPLYIAAEIKGSTLTFALYGEETQERYRLESELVEELPYHCRYEDGSIVPDPAAATLLTEGHSGARSRLYRLCSVDGTTTRTLIRENLYPAKDAIYRRAA